MARDEVSGLCVADQDDDGGAISDTGLQPNIEDDDVTVWLAELDDGTRMRPQGDATEPDDLSVVGVIEDQRVDGVVCRHR